MTLQSRILPLGSATDISVSCDIYKAVPGKECYVHGLDETGIITKIRIETVLNLQ